MTIHEWLVKFASTLVRYALYIILILFGLGFTLVIGGLYYNHQLAIKVGLAILASIFVSMLCSITASFIIEYSKYAEEEINEGRRYTVDELKLLFCIEPDNNGYWTVSFLERRKNCRLIGRFTEYDRDYFILDLPVDAYGKIQGNIDECSFTKFEVIPRDGKKTDFDQKRIEKSTKTFGSMKIFIPEARALTETKNKVIDEINVKRVYPSKARVWPIEKNSDKESATFSYWIMIPVKRITIEVKVKNDNPKRYKVLEPVVIDWEDRDFGEEIKKSPESIKKGEEGDTVGRWVLTPTKSNRFYIGSKLKVTVERERLP